jgi:thioredoxin reductase (NADPH)
VYGASEGLSVLLVEQWAMGGQAGTSSRIENYLGFPTGISGDDLSERAVRQAKRFGAELILTRRVTALEQMSDRAYRVTLDGEETITAKTIILLPESIGARLSSMGSRLSAAKASRMALGARNSPVCPAKASS